MSNTLRKTDFAIDEKLSTVASYAAPAPFQPPCESEETFVSSATLPPERDALLRSLAYLRELEDNFDGHGTLVPEKEVIDTAERFISTCFGCMYPTAVYPGMDRGLEFLYEGGTAEMPIHIVVDRDYLYISRIRSGSIEKIGAFFLPLHGAALPKQIKDVLPPYRVVQGGNTRS